MYSLTFIDSNTLKFIQILAIRLTLVESRLSLPSIPHFSLASDYVDIIYQAVH
ncbi:hypothetical protein SAMN05216175_101100 [Neptunomonas qingdaonensis]|uniref:Uncharacterized protein n=1 Tax=Neptunomonas qingdaonensis TaxID=1045558 RepID=A0A1I2LN76_9GAMM|nr:hypothetical protein SAMN05216175_101100 [Neptunomonas qingdaonensis]